jgi:iodotyrosine deiodinase|tara:strand:- start:234 stop:890 length:657 start_codon:yes stop_codon:yes gene_type:complete
MQIPLNFKPLSDQQMLQESEQFYQDIKRRRTVRDFSEQPVDRAIIENAVRAAGTAPSGAHKQPWHFAIIANPAVKKIIRIAAEGEEREFYEGKAPQAWLDDLKVFETNAQKPFLDTAPYLIAVFLERNTIDADGIKHKNYYMPESVGIATGMLLTALHTSGLATLTHTPSPMKFLNEILGRPSNEKPYMLIVTGHPAQDATVPDITRKPFDEIASLFY